MELLALSLRFILGATGKAKLAETVEAEKILEDAWNLAEAVSSIDAALKPLGQLFVRIGLKLCRLEKKVGREGKVYTFLDIKKLFLKDLGALLGKTIEYPKWFGDDEQESLVPETDETEPSEAVKAFATIQNHFDPVWMCAQSGFKLGSKVIEKGVEASSERPGIFVVFSIGETVTLHEACHYGGAPVRANISVEELLRNWSITKADPPLRMQDPSSTAVPTALNMVLKKNKVFSALLDAHSKNQQHLADLCYFRRPDQVRTKDVQIKASALTLVPYVPLNNIVIDSKANARIIEVEKIDGHMFSIIPTSRPGHEGDVWDKDAAMPNAYFWVKETNDKKFANMTASVVVSQGVKIPVIKNSCALEPFTKLYIYVKPKAASAPLQNVIDDDDDDDADDDDDEDDDEPKARPKAKAKAKTKAVAKAKASVPPAKRGGSQSTTLAKRVKK